MATDRLVVYLYFQQVSKTIYLKHGHKFAARLVMYKRIYLEHLALPRHSEALLVPEDRYERNKRRVTFYDCLQIDSIIFQDNRTSFAQLNAQKSRLFSTELIFACFPDTPRFWSTDSLDD